MLQLPATVGKALGVEPTLWASLSGLAFMAAERFGILDPNEQAAWLAQMAHESAGFRSVRESLNYSVDGLLKSFASWGRMTPEQARAWGRTATRKADQRAIANCVYAHRMGNGGPETGDGWAFRGGGYLQVTGRANYRQTGRDIGRNLEESPGLIEQPGYAMLASAAYWSRNQLGTTFRRGGIDAVSSMVNTGTTSKVAHAASQRAELFAAAVRAMQSGVA